MGNDINCDTIIRLLIKVNDLEKRLLDLELFVKLNKLKELASCKDNYKSIIGSNTAKGGYKEEKLVCRDLNTNRTLIRLIEDMFACKLGKFERILGRKKTDIWNLNRTIKIQVKKTKNGQFGQVDRRCVSDMIKYIPQLEPIKQFLTGLCELPVIDGLVDKNQPVKKLDNENYTNEELDNFIKVLNENRYKILQYSLLGFDNDYKPNYLVSVYYTSDNIREKIVIYKTKDIIENLKEKSFVIGPKKTTVNINECFSIQRKGGDNGRPSSNQIQCKIVLNRLNIQKSVEYNLR